MYERLEEYLRKLKEDSVSMTFRDLMAILGAELPSSAYRHPAWWANQKNTKGRPQAAAWTNAGFKVSDSNLDEDNSWVTFTRLGAETPENAAPARGQERRRRSTQVTGNIGLYYACHKLSLLGWNVMPTARNARGIDVVAYKEDGESFIGVQVKALSTRTNVPLGNSLDKLIGDWWVIVNNIDVDPQCFVLKPKEVKDNAMTFGRRPSHWLAPSFYEAEEYRNAWLRIGEA